jgi:uncharacterized protein DUF4157
MRWKFWSRKAPTPATPASEQASTGAPVPRAAVGRAWTRLPGLTTTIHMRPPTLVPVLRLPAVAGTRSLLHRPPRQPAGLPSVPNGQVAATVIDLPVQPVMDDRPEPEPIEEPVRPVPRPVLTRAVDEYVGTAVEPEAPFRSVSAFERTMQQYLSDDDELDLTALIGFSSSAAPPPMPSETPAPLRSEQVLHRPTLAQSRKLGLRPAAKAGDAPAFDEHTEETPDEPDGEPHQAAPRQIDHTPAAPIEPPAPGPAFTHPPRPDALGEVPLPVASEPERRDSPVTPQPIGPRSDLIAADAPADVVSTAREPIEPRPPSAGPVVAAPLVPKPIGPRSNPTAANTPVRTAPTTAEPPLVPAADPLGVAPAIPTPIEAPARIHATKAKPIESRSDSPAEPPTLPSTEAPAHLQPHSALLIAAPTPAPAEAPARSHARTPEPTEPRSQAPTAPATTAGEAPARRHPTAPDPTTTPGTNTDKSTQDSAVPMSTVVVPSTTPPAAGPIAPTTPGPVAPARTHRPGASTPSSMITDPAAIFARPATEPMPTGAVYRAPLAAASPPPTPAGHAPWYQETHEAVPAELAGAFMTTFGVDITAVPVRRGSVVSDQARHLGARAFTRGGEVYLPDEEGHLGSPGARSLLAHELVHAAQQHLLGDTLPAEESAEGRALEDLAVTAERWALGESAPPVALVHRHVPAAPAQVRPPDTVQRAEGDVITAFLDAARDERQAEDTSGGMGGDAGGQPAPEVTQVTKVASWAVPEPEAWIPRPEPPAQPMPDLTGMRDQLSTMELELAEVRAQAFDPADRRSLDDLAVRLYDRLRGRLRAELLVDRERAGTLADRG